MAVRTARITTRQVEEELHIAALAEQINKLSAQLEAIGSYIEQSRTGQHSGVLEATPSRNEQLARTDILTRASTARSSWFSHREHRVAALFLDALPLRAM